MSHQPHSRLWFSAIDSNRWTRHIATGPTQSGKSLNGFVIPTLYHLFEMNEDVICVIPMMDMAGDKWRRDILPAILASRYASLLPTRGAGSRGGSKLTAIQFSHGPTLRFMSGGGDDKTRAGYTSRVVVGTEINALADEGLAEGEPDRLRQIEDRTLFYGNRARIYLECTVAGFGCRIWDEYINGTQSQIICTCPSCNTPIIPLVGEGPDVTDIYRTHLMGWQDAPDEISAEEGSFYSCPHCSHQITQAERYNMNSNATLLHTNERTRTFSYRWSCFNNMFDSGQASFVGSKEYRGANAEDDEAAKELTTYIWTLPYSDKEDEFEHISTAFIRAKTNPYARSILPQSPSITSIAVGIDVGKRALHYTIIGQSDDPIFYILEYGTNEVLSSTNLIEKAVYDSLSDLHFTLTNRYPIQIFYCDVRYATDAVASISRLHNNFYPVRSVDTGFRPPEFTKATFFTANRYFIKYDTPLRTKCSNIDATYWKSELYRRLLVLGEVKGSISLHKPHDHTRHLEFAKHLTSEIPEQKGGRLTFKQISHSNHWFDSTTYALAALHHKSITINSTSPPVAHTAEPVPININLTDLYRSGH